MLFLWIIQRGEKQSNWKVNWILTKLSRVWGKCQSPRAVCVSLAREPLLSFLFPHASKLFPLHFERPMKSNQQCREALYLVLRSSPPPPDDAQFASAAHLKEHWSTLVHGLTFPPCDWLFGCEFRVGGPVVVEDLISDPIIVELKKKSTVTTRRCYMAVLIWKLACHANAFTLCSTHCSHRNSTHTTHTTEEAGNSSFLEHI